MSDGETAEENDLIPCYESVSLLGLTPKEFAAIAPSISASNIISLWVDSTNNEDHCRIIHSINPAIDKNNYILLMRPHKSNVRREYFGEVKQKIEEKINEEGIFKETVYKDGELYFFKYFLSKQLTPGDLADFVKIYGPLGNASINAHLSYVPVEVHDAWSIPHQKLHSNGLRKLAIFSK